MDQQRTLKARSAIRWIAIVGLLIAPGVHAATAHAASDETQQPVPPAPVRETLYLNHPVTSDESNDIERALRNMVPNAALYYLPPQHAITIRGSAEDVAIVKRMLSELDRGHRLYRLEYTFTTFDRGARVGEEHFTMTVLAGDHADLKQGTKVPIMIGNTQGSDGAIHSEVQYQDVGVEIEAHLDDSGDAIRLGYKIGQSRVSEEHASVGPQDPAFHQTLLDSKVTLAPGKPLVLGSIDMPGTTQREEIEVTASLIR